MGVGTHGGQILVIGDAEEAVALVKELLTLGHHVHWLGDGLSAGDIGEHSRLHRYPGYTLRGLEGQIGAFEAALEGQGGGRCLVVDVAAIALGSRRALSERARRAIEAGWPVWALSDLKAALRKSPQIDLVLKSNRRREHLALVLDLDGNFTPRETAWEALELVEQARREWQSEVMVFYRELRVDASDGEVLYRRMRGEGIVFSRYDRLELSWDGATLWVSSDEEFFPFTRLVWPEEVSPGSELETLAAVLGIHLGQDGYVQLLNVRQNRAGLTNRRGVYAVGRCHRQCTRKEAVLEAYEVAAAIDALLAAPIEPEGPVAHVDTNKCVRCLTCLRTCPHGAVEFREEEGVYAAHILERACFGCGACVSNCPAQAIALQGYSLPDWAASPQVGQGVVGEQV